MALARAPEPPYVAVLFTTERSDDSDGYFETDAELGALVLHQPGFLGVETVDDGKASISVSYWETEQHAQAWKQVADHRAAQQLGRHRWFRSYRVRVARVEREYGFDSGN